MKILTIASAKGGVGKTTVTENLAMALARQTGRTVLAVDLDPQNALALHLGPVAGFFQGAHHLVLVELGQWLVLRARPGAQLGAACGDDHVGLFVRLRCVYPAQRGLVVFHAQPAVFALRHLQRVARTQLPQRGRARCGLLAHMRCGGFDADKFLGLCEGRQQAGGFGSGLSGCEAECRESKAGKGMAEHGSVLLAKTGMKMMTAYSTCSGVV